MEEKKRAGVQTKSVPCFYKMSLHKVAAPVPFGTNLNCFSVPTRSLAGRVLVGARCCRCRLECPLLLFPLPLPWYARCPSLLHSSLLPLTSTWLPRRYLSFSQPAADSSLVRGSRIEVRGKREEVASYRPRPGAPPFSLAAARPASSPASGGGSHGCNAHQASGSGKRCREHASLHPKHRTATSTRPASERSEALKQVKSAPNLHTLAT